MRRKAALEAAADARLAVDDELCIVALQRMFHDRQTQTGSALIAAPPAVHPIEAFGQPGQVFRCNTDPGVGNLDLQSSAVRRAARVTVPPEGVYLTAFDSRLPKTLRSSPSTP